MVRNNKKKFSVKVKQQIVASTFSYITMILWDIIHSCVLSKHTDGLTAGNWKMTLFMICKICLLVQECLQSCRISVLLIDFCPAQYNYENESLSKSFQFVHLWIILWISSANATAFCSFFSDLCLFWHISMTFINFRFSSCFV